MCRSGSIDEEEQGHRTVTCCNYGATASSRTYFGETGDFHLLLFFQPGGICKVGVEGWVPYFLTNRYGATLDLPCMERSSFMILSSCFLPHNFGVSSDLDTYF